MQRQIWLTVFVVGIILVGTYASNYLFAPMLSDSTADLKYVWDTSAPSPDSADLKGTVSIAATEAGGREVTLQATVVLSDAQEAGGSAEPDQAGLQLAKARNFAVQVDMFVVSVAFAAAAIFTGVTAVRCMENLTGSRAGVVLVVVVIVGFLGGAAMLSFDPIGPVVSADVWRPSSFVVAEQSGTSGAAGQGTPCKDSKSDCDRY